MYILIYTYVLILCVHFSSLFSLLSSVLPLHHHGLHQSRPHRQHSIQTVLSSSVHLAKERQVRPAVPAAEGDTDRGRPRPAGGGPRREG